MSTSTESYTAGAGKTREGTENSVETFKQGIEKFTDQANVALAIGAFLPDWMEWGCSLAAELLLWLGFRFTRCASSSTRWLMRSGSW